MAAPLRLLLVGAGHCHLEILRRLGDERPAGIDVTVISPVTRHVYSGMVPGYLAGQYSFEDVSIDVAEMCRRAGATLAEGHAEGVDPAARTVRLAGGSALAYDVVSFNVGSRTIGGDEPGVRAHALVLKPFDRVAEIRRRVEALAASGPGEARLLVIGGGAAGIEAACASDAVLARSGRRRAVTVLEAGARILPGYADRVATLAIRVLAARGIAVRTGAPVAEPDAAGVRFRSGEHLAANLVLWLVGTAALPVFQGSGLPLDDRGFLLVDALLRATGDPRVFAAGDCATPADHPDTPKAGVYAVREAPILWANLMAVARGAAPTARYVPQTGFLSLLNTCDGRAILRYKGMTTHARWAWRLKDWIDRRFVRRYQLG